MPRVVVADHSEQHDGEDERQHAREDMVKDAREDGLAESTDGQAGPGHTELHGGNEARGVGEQSLDAARPPVALRLELGNAGAAGRDERVLGRDEVRVQEDQRPDREE